MMRNIKPSAGTALLALISAQIASAAIAPGIREKESLEIARILRPIPDEEWQTIAGERASQKYEVVRGDTLFDISRRLFGDARYWPKVWALNNDTITNPHLIRPGREIAFLPGTGVSLPAVAIGNTESASDSPIPADSPRTSLTLPSSENREASPTRRRRSQEWKKLPNQPWELLDITLPPDVDPMGFDQKTKLNFGRGKKGFELPGFIQSERLDFLGEILGAQKDGNYIGTGDTVFVTSNGALQVGEIYDLTQDPALLKAEDLFARTGYAYRILGAVRITGVKDQIFTASVVSTKEPIPRGAKLILSVPRVKIQDPVVGPGPMEATLLIDKRFGTFDTAQHKQVFLDRGTDDGIQPGMVFRYFEYRDPATQELISETGLMKSGDIMVVQVTPRFSSGIVLSSGTTLRDSSKLTLLTDISDVFAKGRHAADVLEEIPPAAEELDALEQLDGGAGLGKGEARELRQLEKYEEQPTETPPTAEPSEDIPPQDELPPPPSEELEFTSPPVEDEKEMTPPTASEEIPEAPIIEEILPEDEGVPPPPEMAPPPPPPAGDSESTEAPPEGEDFPAPPPLE